MSRVFDAPRSLVFDAWTKPELLKRWLGVRGGWSMVVCEVDLRVGGAYRFVWRGPDGAEMGMGGVYREIVAPERLVATESFDDPWYPGEAVDTTLLVEEGGKTRATTTVLSAFCIASTWSSAAAQASRENGLGIGVSPCPGRSTITTW